DRDRPAERKVAGAEDFAHPTGADALEDLVVADARARRDTFGPRLDGELATGIRRLESHAPTEQDTPRRAQVACWVRCRISWCANRVASRSRSTSARAAFWDASPTATSSSATGWSRGTTFASSAAQTALASSTCPRCTARS